MVSRRFRDLFRSPSQVFSKSRHPLGRELGKVFSNKKERHTEASSTEREERAQENENAVESNRETTLPKQGNE